MKAATAAAAAAEAAATTTMPDVAPLMPSVYGAVYLYVLAVYVDLVQIAR